VLAVAGVLGLAVGLAFHLGAHVASFRFMPYFALGGALYFALRGRLAAGVLAAVLLALCLYDFAHSGGPAPSRPWLAQYVLLLVGLTLICGLFHVSAGGFRRWDKRLGDLSYPLYLNQYVVIVTLHSLFAPSILLLVISVPVAFALGMAADKVLDPLTRGLRDKVRGVSLDAPGGSPQPSRVFNKIDDPLGSIVTDWSRPQEEER
jgi:peptidoglycan/LPS O-acetylase OafA/YrhL